MRPVNIYTLTRVRDDNSISRLERQLSSRSKFLNIKEWEVAGLRALADRLTGVMGEVVSLEFYYSFIIPKIGKEFDLLMISEEGIINIELKSGQVSDETIREQLMLNRHYLASLGRNTHLYTYISGEDRLVRLTNSDNLIEAEWNALAEDIARCAKDLYRGDIEGLFNEANFMVSPMAEPERFLRRDYLLTSQQKDIRKHILRDIAKADGTVREGFTGLPGTGKTMLLYDLAMELSEKAHVVVLHFGSFPKELEYLGSLLRRVHIYDCRSTGNVCEEIRVLAGEKEITCMMIDEAHHMELELLDKYMEAADEIGVPVIFSYDSEEVIAEAEKSGSAIKAIRALPDFVEYKLTNRIRTNRETSGFIYSMMKLESYHNNRDYPSVEISYASNETELALILGRYIDNGYLYIAGTCDEKVDPELVRKAEASGLYLPASEATCGEADAVVMIADEKFYYDEEQYLRASGGQGYSPVRTLFHGLNRARNRVAMVVYNNGEILDAVLGIVQGPSK